MNDHAVMTLLGIGSVATALAGFSGVVAAFSGRDGKWQPAERFRITNMLVLSAGACLLSFVPLTEELLPIPDRALWIGASLSLLMFCLVYFVRTIVLLRRPSLRRPGVLVEWVRVVYFACLALAIVWQALSVAGILVERGPGPFIAGLVFMLIPAGLMFVFLVLTPLSSTKL
ncbi:MAG TPA: hypothetical protein VEV39_00270 [Gemmatimonadales bacterium]|nr:hypothetical protein [Gemmatimonadales bacterium]